jgi:hypothetical protein
MVHTDCLRRKALAVLSRLYLINGNMRFLFFPLVLLLLVSCSSISLTPINTGSDPNWVGGKQYEVLVAIRLYDPEMRALFERKMAAALKKEGVRAVPSFSVLPQQSSLNSQVFSQFLAASPALVVYFAQATAVSKELANSNREDSNMFAELFGGGEWDTTLVARVESALYVHGQTNAVWWNRISLDAKEELAEDVADRFVSNEIAAMKLRGAIQRLR